ncbi:cupin domain-containing protein [Chitinophaga arvensicola]|uniref:Cupin domain-containing protein n=1 Tax=Chitinophaga arvensicola TaxID=29529 RepID=A0A1I0R9V5_9BACT|nr:cupin domain-containing protein [Chitinophaga arvensicola]SEW36991.1 Cupin domain-containing protein [Chitinophaga arvensicola]
MMFKIAFSFLMTPCLCIGICHGQSKKPAAGSQNSEGVFPKGAKITNSNFTGTVYLYPMIAADSINATDVGNVTFEAGARSRWHLHPGGQILLVTGGKGYYQEKGQRKVILRKGDYIKCPPNVAHWHGASADSAFSQVAVTGREKGPTVWLEAVEDTVYLAGER